MNVALSLLTLTVLEVVLGIDNIVMVIVIASKLPKHQQKRARVLGLGAAMLSRIALLCCLSWMMSLTVPLFTVHDYDLSWRDLILLAGGLFLIWKSAREIHEKLEKQPDGKREVAKRSFLGTIVQIMVLDIIFSLDSVITAVGMSNQIWVMVAAVVIAVVLMMVASNVISQFIEQHPSIKVLALSFLLLIGVLLLAEGLHQHIDRGYIYFAMGFSFLVQLLNIRAEKKDKPAEAPTVAATTALGDEASQKAPVEPGTDRIGIAASAGEKAPEPASADVRPNVPTGADVGSPVKA